MYRESVYLGRCIHCGCEGFQNEETGRIYTDNKGVEFCQCEFIPEEEEEEEDYNIPWKCSRCGRLYDFVNEAELCCRKGERK